MGYKQPDLHKTHRTSDHHRNQNLNSNYSIRGNLQKMTNNNQLSSFKNKSVLVLDMNLKTKKQLVYELLELGSDAPEKLILWNQENAKKPIIDSIRTRQRSECSVSESAVNESDAYHHDVENNEEENDKNDDCLQEFVEYQIHGYKKFDKNETQIRFCQNKNSLDQLLKEIDSSKTVIDCIF